MINKASINIPQRIEKKWKNFLKIISEIVDVSSIFLLHLDEQNFVKIFLSYQKEKFNFKEFDFNKSFCKKVIKSEKRLYIKNIKETENWQNNIFSKAGFTSFLSYPVIFPDLKTAWGTICIIDKNEIDLIDKHEKLIIQFKDIIEDDLQTLIDNYKKELKLKQKIKNSRIEVKKFHEAVEQSHNTVVITDFEGNIEYVNKRFVEVTGYSEDEVIGKNMNILKSGIQNKKFYENLWKTIKSGKIWQGQFQNKTKYGEIFHEQATITPVKNYEGKITNFIGIKLDITEIQIIEERLKTLLNALPDAIFFKDADGRWIEANESALELFELKNVNYRGKTDKDLSEYTSFYKNVLLYCIKTDKEAWKKEEMSILEEKVPMPDGTTKLFETRKIPLFNDDKTKKGLVVIGRDITERKLSDNALKTQKDEYEALYEEYKAQNEQLLKAKEAAEESNRLKTDFLHNMSHEIRTPMNAIVGFANLLNNVTEDKQKLKEYVNVINDSSKQLLRIIDEIIEVSKLYAKKVTKIIKPVHLNGLLDELCTFYKLKFKKPDIEFKVNKTLSDEDCYILSDEQILTKIIGNLLDNALKFTEKGYIEIGYNIINNKILKIYIKDTGIGIAKDKQDIIFKYFTQADSEIGIKYGGLGLGLAIAKLNTKILEGDIKCVSQEGKGATFYVELPYRLTKDKKKNTTINKISKDEYKILIAEDEKFNFLSLKESLFEISDKFKIYKAQNGKEAIKKCKENDFDIILLDLEMPIMSGFEACKKIKQIKPDLNIIAQSAHSSTEDKQRAFNAGFDDFLEKPFEYKTLKKIISKYLEL